MKLWHNPISWFQKILSWIGDFLSEVWLFSMAVFILWHPAFPERLQNGIVIAGLMSVATALIRLKKIEHKIDEMRTTQMLREGRSQAKFLERLKRDEDKAETAKTS